MCNYTEYANTTANVHSEQWRHFGRIIQFMLTLLALSLSYGTEKEFVISYVNDVVWEPVPFLYRFYDEWTTKSVCFGCVFWYFLWNSSSLCLFAQKVVLSISTLEKCSKAIEEQMSPYLFKCSRATPRRSECLPCNRGVSFRILLSRWCCWGQCSCFWEGQSRLRFRSGRTRACPEYERSTMHALVTPPTCNCFIVNFFRRNQYSETTFVKGHGVISISTGRYA